MRAIHALLAFMAIVILALLLMPPSYARVSLADWLPVPLADEAPETSAFPEFVGGGDRGDWPPATRRRIHV